MEIQKVKDQWVCSDGCRFATEDAAKTHAGIELDADQQILLDFYGTEDTTEQEYFMRRQFRFDTFEEATEFAEILKKEGLPHR